MAGGREIKTKIGSVKNTRKVTSALEMVSASKIRKSQDLMAASRPYSQMMRQVIGHLSKANPEYKHPYTVVRDEIKRVGYILISTDRGLCGGLNSNLFRKLLGAVREHHRNNIEVDMVAIGRKGVQFFRNIKNVELVGSATHLGEKPQLQDLIGVIKVMLDAYREGKIDELTLVFNDFVNTMTQAPTLMPLLPLPASEEEGMLKYWDYIYEPDATQLLDEVLTRYIESLVYQGVLENLASEHAARMIAMKNASDNAGKLIDELNLAYNKARQAAITQEISEIVGGAAAV
ncbi:MAG: F0F1 ATP synthase subunit gamma [Wenzhouxiangellaceae bacterium]